MNVSITSPDLKARIAEVKALGDQANARKLLGTDDVRRELEQASARRFQRGIKQAGRQWRMEKRRRGLVDRPMRATDTGFDALTRRSGAGSSVIFKTSSTGVIWGVRRGGSELYYLHIHAAGKGGRPKRRVVAVDSLAREAIAERMVRILVKPIT